MKTNPQRSRMSGLTFIEAVALAAVLFIALVWIRQVIQMMRPRARGHPINCVSNLKQIGLAMRMWSNDHSDKFPWNVSTNEGGTMEFLNSQQVFHHYLAASNELTSPNVLACPRDTQRKRATAWDQLTNDTHISYFVGLEADEAKPQTILSGDRNLTTNGRPATGKVTLTTATGMGWTKRIHTNAGNVGLGDGSAWQTSAKDLQAQVQSALSNLNMVSIRLVIP